jgi:hypothetical protein
LDIQNLRLITDPLAASSLNELEYERGFIPSLTDKLPVIIQDELRGVPR